IILQYPEAQAVLQASWNWPFSRKDMEVYGTQGYAVASDATTLRYRFRGGNTAEETRQLKSREAPFNDPFSVLAAVVNGSLVLDQSDLYGLSINIITVEILEAAMKSAAQQKTIYLPE